MSKKNFNQNICESCWIDQRGEWEDLEAGYQKLVSVPLPVRLLEPELCLCAFCGKPTISGILVREDPDNVPYPAANENEIII